MLVVEYASRDLHSAVKVDVNMQMNSSRKRRRFMKSSTNSEEKKGGGKLKKLGEFDRCVEDARSEGVMDTNSSSSERLDGSESSNLKREEESAKTVESLKDAGKEHLTHGIESSGQEQLGIAHDTCVMD